MPATRAQRPPRHSTSIVLAGILLCISAALHVFAVLVAGLHFGALLLLLIGFVYFALALTFLKESPYWVRATIVVMLAGIAGARGLQILEWGAPGWWLSLIIWADIAVAVMLVIYVIRHR